MTKEAESFLDQVEEKLIQLLKESPNPRSEIDQAVRRFDRAGLLGSRPDPDSSPTQAAFLLISQNPNLQQDDLWREIRTADLWPAAESPQELVSAILPDSGDSE